MEQRRKKRVLFYYLSAFGNTGGIEKFNRCFIKAMNEIADEGMIDCSIVSVYDEVADERYIQHRPFIGFKKKKGRSVLHIIRQSFHNDIIILGHINLSVAGWLVKLINPRCKVYLVAHGIEVWSKLFMVKKWGLKRADCILSVSNYTKNQLVLRNCIEPAKIKLFPNTIDPYFNVPITFDKPGYLLERYGISKRQPVIMTLSRLVSSEKYKGYDQVISAFPKILKAFPDAFYILAGRYDEGEKERVEKLVKEYQVSGRVLLTGYIKDSEVPDHYCLADVFIMPSRKEGFGIVFLEALACGTPVVGGNQDGTVDALHNGALGRLINPTKTGEIAEAITEALALGINSLDTQKNVISKYAFIKYRERLKRILNEQH